MATVARQDPFESEGMGYALLFALVIHAIIIVGIGFRLERTEAPSPTIEVTLARHQSEKSPEESDYIAQFNQEGSGTSENRKEMTTDRLAPLESTVFRETEFIQPVEEQMQRKQAAEQEVLTSINESSQSRLQAEDETVDGGVQTNPQTLEEIASLRAKLAIQRQSYSKIPRKLILTAASARASDHAEYLRQWIEWVEQVGNENYPEEARRKQIYGAIRLAVTLERDGNVAGVEILSSSGQRVLDQAAIRIVRMAAPFAPIPSSIKEDQVEVIRTWNFIPGNQFHTSSN